MDARQSLYVQGLHVGVVLAAIIAVAILGYHGTLDGQSVVAVLGGAIGYAGANASSIGSLAQAVNGKAVIPASEMANRESTLRTAFGAAAQSESHTIEPYVIADKPKMENK